MKTQFLAVLSLLAAAGIALPARAEVANLTISGPGVSGQIAITYDTGSPITSGGFAITDVSGTFSDTNADLSNAANTLNIVNATITGPVAITVLSTRPDGVLATDFNTFAVANDVPSGQALPSPSLSFDNTYYPDGSPIVCSDYPAFGGVLDVYGVLFTLSNGDVVDLWSNGESTVPPIPLSYGIAVADATNTYDYQNAVTVTVPEPSSLALLALAATALLLPRRRKPVTA